MIERLRASWLALLLPLLAAVAAAQSSPPPARTGTVQGVVLGPLGQPMPDVEVLAAKDYPSGNVAARTRTDGAGMFVLARLPADGWHTIVASAPGHTTSRAPAQLGVEQLHAVVELRVYEANTLRGRVLGPDGQPVADAVVLGTKDLASFVGQMVPRETRTDANGRFELAGVPIGDCVLRAFSPGLALRQYWLNTMADAEVELRLTREPGVQLAITTEGLPAAVVANTTVRIHVMNGNWGFVLPSTVERPALDEQGAVRLSGLPTGQYEVRLDAPGFTFDPRRLCTEQGQASHELRFRAVPDGSMMVRGTLRTVAGTPLAGQRLVCSPLSGGRSSTAVSDAEGRFTMMAPLLAGESYSLKLVDSDWVLRQGKDEGFPTPGDPRSLVRWDEVADAGRDLALLAERAAVVTVRAIDAQGRPVPLARAYLQLERPPNWHPRWGTLTYATGSVDGHLVFAGVPGGEGTMRVHVDGAAGAGDSESFELAAGQRLEVSISCQLPGTVIGKVRDAAGRPVAGAHVWLGSCDLATGKRIGGTSTTVPSDREGRFAFTSVAPGGYQVEIGRRSPGSDGASQPFEVVSETTIEVELRVAK